MGDRRRASIALRTAIGERIGFERGLGPGIGLMSLILPQVGEIGVKGVILVTPGQGMILVTPVQGMILIIPVEFLEIGLERSKKICFQE